jgi:5-methylcytosine-specific restriction endonuclease McrA
MIKLELAQKPDKLTDEFALAKTKEFKENPQKAVWNIPWLRREIAGMSYRKCYFSETRIEEDSKYMEVEHFLPKSLYPDKVMEWGNLFPSCVKCNRAKGEHDPLQEPIVNPFVDDPKEYFYFENCLYQAKNNNIKAKRTIKVTHINDYRHFVIPRARVYDEMKYTLKNIYGDVLRFPDGPKDTYYERLINLMRKGVRTEAYAAITATAIYSDPRFEELTAIFRANNLLTAEFENLKEELKFCSLSL